MWLIYISLCKKIRPKGYRPLQGGSPLRTVSPKNKFWRHNRGRLQPYQNEFGQTNVGSAHLIGTCAHFMRKPRIVSNDLCFAKRNLPHWILFFVLLSHSKPVPCIVYSVKWSEARGSLQKWWRLFLSFVMKDAVPHRFFDFVWFLPVILWFFVISLASFLLFCYRFLLTNQINQTTTKLRSIVLQ